MQVGVEAGRVRFHRRIEFTHRRNTGFVQRGVGAHVHHAEVERDSSVGIRRCIGCHPTVGAAHVLEPPACRAATPAELDHDLDRLGRQLFQEARLEVRTNAMRRVPVETRLDVAIEIRSQATAAISRGAEQWCQDFLTVPVITAPDSLDYDLRFAVGTGR